MIPVNMDRDCRWLPTKQDGDLSGPNIHSNDDTKNVWSDGITYTAKYLGVDGFDVALTNDRVYCGGVHFDLRNDPTPYRIMLNAYADQPHIWSVYAGDSGTISAGTNTVDNCVLLGTAERCLNFDEIFIWDRTTAPCVFIELASLNANTTVGRWSLFVQDLSAPDTSYIKVAP